MPTTDIERGRPITPTEFDSGRNVAIAGLDTADRLFGAIDPIDKTITMAGVHFRIVGVAEKKGALFGQSQDEYAIIPLGAFQRVFGSRRSLQLTVKPRDPSLVQHGDGRDHGGAADRAAAPPEGTQTTSACSRPKRS